MKVAIKTTDEKQAAIKTLSSLITQIKEDKIRIISLDMNRSVHRVGDTPDGYQQYEPDSNIDIHIQYALKRKSK